MKKQFKPFFLAPPNKTAKQVLPRSKVYYRMQWHKKYFLSLFWKTRWKSLEKNNESKKKWYNRKRFKKCLLLIWTFWFGFSKISDQKLLWLFTHDNGKNAQKSSQKQTREICEKASIFLMPIFHRNSFLSLLAIFLVLLCCDFSSFWFIEWNERREANQSSSVAQCLHYGNL